MRSRISTGWCRWRRGGRDWSPPAEVSVKPDIDTKTPVPRQVLAMTPETFFGRLNALLPANPPYRKTRL